MNLKNKVAIVTGASDGLGKQIALKLAKEGVKLALIARSEERLEEIKRLALEAGSSKCEFYPCDIRDSAKLGEIVKKIAADFDGINILINDAGVWQKLGFLEDLPEETIDEVIDINLKGLIKITRLVIPYLKEQKDAAIINISSKSGVTAQPGQSIYTASKWGVTGFSEVLKGDLKDTTVRVATIHQGGVDTGMFDKTGEHLNQEKFIRPEDLADVVLFMLSRPGRIWLHDVRVEY